MTTAARKTAAAKAPAKDAAMKDAAIPAPSPTRNDTPPADTLAAAMVRFQAEMPKVAKGNTATIPGRDGRTGYSYKYADLGDVMDAAQPIMAKMGLSFMCLPRLTASGGYELAGRLTHTSGEYVEGALPLYGRDAQGIGSAITYARRYLLGCMTGIVTDEDEDGAIAAAARERSSQADAPASQAPAPLAAHQQIVSDFLRDLTEEEGEQLKAWARANQVPAIRDLTPAQSARFMAYLEWLVGQRTTEAPEVAADTPAWEDAHPPAGAR